MKRCQALATDRQGVALVEFALLAPVLLIVLLGLTELGFQQYLAMQLQGTLDQAARQVTVGGVTQSQIQSLVETRVHAIWAPATVTVVPQSFDNFSRVGKPEPITSDANKNGVVEKGDCFIDVNGNGTWDSNAGSSNLGSGDDVVYYTATASYTPIMPLAGLLKWTGPTKVSATMMMRNQPYAAQLDPPTVCL